MYRNGRYQFTISLPPGEKGAKVGRILESLGRAKGYIIMLAMEEYLDKQPQLNNISENVFARKVSEKKITKSEKPEENKQENLNLAKTEKREAERQESNTLQVLLEQIQKNPELLQKMSQALMPRPLNDKEREIDDEFDDNESDLMFSAFQEMENCDE